MAMKTKGKVSEIKLASVKEIPKKARVADISQVLQIGYICARKK